MPATEQTSRNLKTLHVVFGISSLLLLLVTIWLLASDHNREAKTLQKNFSLIETRFLQWRAAEQLTTDFVQKRDALKAEVTAARQTKPDEAPIASFLNACGRTYFKLTGESLSQLKKTVAENDQLKEQVPEEELTKLESLKDKVYLDESELRKALASTLSQDSPDAFSDLIVESASVSRLHGSYFRLTDRAIKNLAGKGFDDDLKKLEPLRDKIYFYESDFRSALAHVLTPESLEKNGKAIYENAAVPVYEANDYELQSILDAQKDLQALSIDNGKGIEAARDRLLTAMQKVLDQAIFIENESQRKLKFTKADLDVDLSMLAIGIDENKPAAELNETEGKIKDVRGEVEGDLTETYQANKAHRIKLADQLAAIKKPETDAAKALEKHNAEIARLETAIKEKAPNKGKWFLELPILDAFGGPLKPQQIWLPDLPWNNNFRSVARFDRCITCHQGIDKSAPGSAVDPAYETAHDFVVMLETPKTSPTVESLYATESDGTQREKTLNERLSDLYGLTLSSEGLVVDPDAVTVEAVFPRLDGPPSPRDAAVRAGLRSGDIIVKVGDAPIDTKETAQNYLADGPVWGTPLALTIRRGVPHPYASHPRLDLFVGSMSPHKAGDFGCTICHEGQGNGTAFKWASHTPNDMDEMARWTRDWGYFNNHHWIYPMLPERFEEANCLKCHHEVTELKPSERFPEAPAPKLIAGFETIENVGCFGCHEINGYDGPKKRRGPDLRAEPNYFAAASQALADKYLDRATYEREQAELDSLNLKRLQSADPARPADQKQPWTPADQAKLDALKPFVEFKQPLVEALTKVTNNPWESTAARKLAQELIASDAGTPEQPGPHRLQSAATYSMGGIIGADDEAPGKYPKVGPSLRYVDKKNDLAFLYSWIKSPRNYRPSTKMPTFFGLREHLHDWENGHIVNGDDGKPKPTPGSADADRFEPIEIRAVSEYLLSESKAQPYAYAAQPTQWQGKRIEPPDAARGKFLFQTRGCLACHSFTPDDDADKKAFAGIHQTQGPDLSGLGAKLKAPSDASKVNPWLYTWLKNPTTYHARTVMPNLFLDPMTSEERKDAQGNTVPAITTDPAADITAYLTSNKKVDGKEWVAEPVPTNVEKKDLDELLSLYLVGAFPKAEVRRILETGIPAERMNDTKGDEKLLVGDALTEDMKLRYLGKKTIGRLGCAGCHDIPGFEDSKPIGTGLADWGRKEPSKLAFEQVLAYLEHKEGHGHADDHFGPEKADHDFYMYNLGHHQREGFIWQKLREPRSYDYKKTENKSYIDRLRMPQFNLSAEQREAIITFVLGLVAEPPPARYIYRPSPKQEAIQVGQRVIDKYNCAGCHTLRMPEMEIQYEPGVPKAPSVANEFAFLIPHYAPEQIAKSKQPDRRGLGHATIQGLPTPKDDPEDPELPQGFKLWSPTLVDGQSWLSGGIDFGVDERLNPGLAEFVAGLKSPPATGTASADRGEAEPASQKYRPQIGGALANYLHPVGLAQERKFNPNAKDTDAWGFVPPPLMGEGRKVEPRWLHDFLLDPFMIRPQTLLRMPKFNMTSAEAEAIVNHFAAKDGAEFPYEFDERTRADYLSRRNETYRSPAGGTASAGAPDAKRLDDALKLVTDRELCIQCHRIGNYIPPRAATEQAPDLAAVGTRLRPQYLRDWIANPGRILPYTGMPVNFPKIEVKKQNIFAGSSEEQINAVVDLLLNFDRAISRKTTVEPTGTAPPTPGAPGTSPVAAGTPPVAPAVTTPMPPTPAATTPMPTTPMPTTPTVPMPAGTAPSTTVPSATVPNATVPRAVVPPTTVPAPTASATPSPTPPRPTPTDTRPGSP